MHGRIYNKPIISTFIKKNTEILEVDYIHI